MKVKVTQCEGQIKENKFLSTVNVFVICVLLRWYAFEWKAVLFGIYCCLIRVSLVIEMGAQKISGDGGGEPLALLW